MKMHLGHNTKFAPPPPYPPEANFFDTLLFNVNIDRVPYFSYSGDLNTGLVWYSNGQGMMKWAVKWMSTFDQLVKCRIVLSCALLLVFSGLNFISLEVSSLDLVNSIQVALPR